MLSQDDPRLSGKFLTKVFFFCQIYLCKFYCILTLKVFSYSDSSAPGCTINALYCGRTIRSIKKLIIALLFHNLRANFHPLLERLINFPTIRSTAIEIDSLANQFNLHMHTLCLLIPRVRGIERGRGRKGSITAISRLG